MSTQELNNALSASKLFTMGAAHGSVSVAGGWGQTAGHGPFTSLYGLGVDQVLEYKVVIADGSLKVANKVSNPDLFWALRGGGGGTFGVVVEATIKAYQDVPITFQEFWINTTTGANNPELFDAYSYLHTQFPSLVSKGVTGYYYLWNGGIDVKMMTTGKDSGEANVRRIWQPIWDKLNASEALNVKMSLLITYPNFKAFFDGRFGPIESMPDMDFKQRLNKRHGPGGDGNEAVPKPEGIVPLDSRLLGAEHFASPNLTQALEQANPAALGVPMGGLQGHLVAGGKVMDPDDDTSVLPAWRKAYVHVIGIKTLGMRGVDSLRRLAPGSGAYANEADPQDTDWKRTFWGSNYVRLSKIKTKYDPEMVFWTTPGVNADLMEARSEGRVCRTATPAVAMARKTAPKNDNTNALKVDFGGTSNPQTEAGDVEGIKPEGGENGL
ncbi:hypothetical protein LTS18_011099 [Coniosporium uncinatum]|uniref:Uncharacterized protein n=1 Tax=Coniosporium uncinatum TaxID=93489 RepID=A0ACC3DKF1_9PEZI|nr:hypothetical protein LTS18_011099 [Coniosporium uncinatum]